MHAGRYDIVVEQAHNVVDTHQFNNEPLRILVSSLASGLRATDVFLLSTLSKHLLRESRLADAAVRDPDSVRWNNLQRRWAMVSNSTKIDPDEAPDDDDGVEASGENLLENVKP